MYCASACGLPRSRTLELYTCASLTEPVQKCRRLNAHWQSDERRWCLHNNLVLRQLAQMLQRPLELVCRFLYQLTLKKFGEILNPKCSHWNWFRVPLVRPDTCGLYDGIFDTEGNLRNPLHPYILHILLVMMDHYMDLPCQGYADRRYSTVIEQIVTGSNQNKCTDIFADRDGRGAKLRQQWEADGGGKFGGSDYDDGEDKDGKDGMTKGDGDEGDKGDDEGGDGKETAAADDAANKRGGYGLKTGDGSGQDKAKQAKGAKTDDAKKAERKSMKDISNLYEKVVQNKHKRKLVNGPAAVEEDDDDGYVPTAGKKAKPPKPPKKKKYKGTDQKYMGQMLPVLVHEPFDESKPWTWVRRHPRQERVLQGTHVGRINVHRYRRETLEMQFQQAKRTQSVASIYDGGSIESGAMFGYGSIKKKHAAMAKAFDYKRLLESPEEGMARITIAPKKPPKVPPKKQKAK